LVGAMRETSAAEAEAPSLPGGADEGRVHVNDDKTGGACRQLGALRDSFAGRTLSYMWHQPHALTNGVQNGGRWFRECRNVSKSRVSATPRCRQVSLRVGVGRVFGRQSGRQKLRVRRPVNGRASQAPIAVHKDVSSGINEIGLADNDRFPDPRVCDWSP
jgi:hypothetical protein